MGRRMARRTPSRFASRRSAIRKTVTPARRPAVAAAVLPVRHVRALKSGVEANAPARAVATRSPRILASRRFSCHQTARLQPSLRETAFRESDDGRHASSRRVASLRAMGRWTSRAQAPDGNRARKRTGQAAADSPLRSGSPGCPTDGWLSLERPRAACASSAPALDGAGATRTVPGPRPQACEGVVQAISIRLTHQHVDINESSKGTGLMADAPYKRKWLKRIENRSHASRRWNRCTFPVVVFGSSLTYATRCGYV